MMYPGISLTAILRGILDIDEYCHDTQEPVYTSSFHEEDVNNYITIQDNRAWKVLSIACKYNVNRHCCNGKKHYFGNHTILILMSYIIGYIMLHLHQSGKNE